MGLTDDSRRAAPGDRVLNGELRVRAGSDGFIWPRDGFAPPRSSTSRCRRARSSKGGASTWTTGVLRSSRQDPHGRRIAGSGACHERRGSHRRRHEPMGRALGKSTARSGPRPRSRRSRTRAWTMWNALYVGCMSGGLFVGQEHLGPCSPTSLAWDRSGHARGVRVRVRAAGRFRQAYLAVASGEHESCAGHRRREDDRRRRRRPPPTRFRRRGPGGTSATTASRSPALRA